LLAGGIATKESWLVSRRAPVRVIAAAAYPDAVGHVWTGTGAVGRSGEVVIETVASPCGYGMQEEGVTPRRKEPFSLP
jgi:hypothetical protein